MKAAQLAAEHGVRMLFGRASTIEITAFFVAIGALLAISALCSMLWFNRVA